MSEPIMVLAVAGPNGQAVASPLFAAIQLTAPFVARLRKLTALCRRHCLEAMEFRDPDPPVYWDVPAASALDGCIEDHTQWHVQGDHHGAVLWGRRLLDDGSHGPVEVLGCTQMVEVGELEPMLAVGTSFDMRDFDDTESTLGQPFMLAVHARMAALKVRTHDCPPLEPPE